MSSLFSSWSGALLAERYLVQDKLGEGGMGAVYLAHDRNLNDRVVVKTPHPFMLQQPEFAERFAREIRSLVRLSHPHVVKIIDVGQHEGIPFAVMQYLSGGSLADRRPRDAQGRPLPIDPDWMSTWLPDVAKALDFVHRRGYVHRDVKPANILFDEDDNAYLSDFGVAKVVSESSTESQTRGLTGAGMVLGTIDYMAPELIQAHDFDGRSDQYALAVTVYELLAGRPPFSSPTPAAALVVKATLEPPLLSEMAPDAPEPLVACVARALARDPRQRYATCGEFAQAVLDAAAVPTSVSSLVAPEDVKVSDSPPSPVRHACPQCGVNLKLAARTAGKQVSCPKCAAHFTVAADLSGISPSEKVDLLAAAPPPPRPSSLVDTGTSASLVSTRQQRSIRRPASAPLARWVDLCLTKARSIRPMWYIAAFGLLAMLGLISVMLLSSGNGQGEPHPATLAVADEVPKTDDVQISRPTSPQFRRLALQRVRAGETLAVQLEADLGENSSGPLEFSIVGASLNATLVRNGETAAHFRWTPDSATADSQVLFGIAVRDLGTNLRSETTLLVQVESAPSSPPPDKLAGGYGEPPPQPPVIQATPFDASGTLAGVNGNVLSLVLANKQTWQVLIDAPQFGSQSKTQMELRAPARLGMLQSGTLVRFSAMLDESGRHKGLVEQIVVFTPTPETRAGVFSDEQLAAGPVKGGKHFVVVEVNRLRDDVLIVKLSEKPIPSFMSFKLSPDVQLTAEYTDKAAIGSLLKEGDPIHVIGFYVDDGTVFAQKIKIDLPRAIGEESVTVPQPEADPLTTPQPPPDTPLPEATSYGDRPALGFLGNMPDRARGAKEPAVSVYTWLKPVLDADQRRAYTEAKNAYEKNKDHMKWFVAMYSPRLSAEAKDSPSSPNGVILAACRVFEIRGADGYNGFIDSIMSVELKEGDLERHAIQMEIDRDAFNRHSWDRYQGVAGVDGQGLWGFKVEPGKDFQSMVHVVIDHARREMRVLGDLTGGKYDPVSQEELQKAVDAVVKK